MTKYKTNEQYVEYNKKQKSKKRKRKPLGKLVYSRIYGGFVNPT